MATTLGSGQFTYEVEMDWAKRHTSLSAPHGIASDSKGSLYVGEVSVSFLGSRLDPPRPVPCFRKLKKETFMKIVITDGYTLNPGDNPWDEIAALGDLNVYDRTEPSGQPAVESKKCFYNAACSMGHTCRTTTAHAGDGGQCKSLYFRRSKKCCQ